MIEKDIKITISKAPDDPDEKKVWVHHMMRLQIAMWIDGKTACEQCHIVYESVDDFLARNPKRGYGDAFTFVDEGCWLQYEKERKK